MKAALAKVKAALAAKDIATHLTHYLVKDGMVTASDNRITAAAPFDYPGEFLVPGEEFEALIERMDDPVIEVGEHTLTIKSGRLRGTIKILPVSMVTYEQTRGEWSDLPPSFLDAIRKVRPFVSTNAVHMWALSICLGDGMVYASNNIVVAAAECPGLKGEGRLLPAWAADYILSRQETITTLILGPGSMTFMWSDDSWMRTNLIDSTYPEGAKSLIETMAKPTFELTSEWKAAYQLVAGMTDSLIELGPEKMIAHSERASTEFEIATPGLSKWNKKFLDPVIEIATHFQPDSWPQPSPWSGPGVRGLIVGRQ